MNNLLNGYILVIQASAEAPRSSCEVRLARNDQLVIINNVFIDHNLNHNWYGLRYKEFYKFVYNLTKLQMSRFYYSLLDNNLDYKMSFRMS